MLIRLWKTSARFRARALLCACTLFVLLLAALLRPDAPAAAVAPRLKPSAGASQGAADAAPPEAAPALPAERVETGGARANAPSDGGWAGADDAALTAFLARLAALPHYQSERAARYLNYYGSARWTDEEILRIVNTDNDLVPFEQAVPADTGADELVLANKLHDLGAYAPDDLVELGRQDTAYGYGSLRRAAADAFLAMSDAAEADGLFLICNSSYRSARTQQSLYNDYAKRHGTAEADTYSARPGFSEHQTGLALDIAARGSTYDRLAGTPEEAWLTEHAHEYGFILRYGEGMDYITGYTYEPWHFRYVGPEAAAYIRAQGLTLEEYCYYNVPGAS